MSLARANNQLCMARTDSSLPVEQRQYLVAGLPMLTAVVYGLLFVMAFWLYIVLWKDAPVMVSDSGGYLKAAWDLSDFRIDQLQNRTPGYPLLLLLTASGKTPKRTLFFTSLLFHFAVIWMLANVLHAIGLRDIALIFFALLLLLPPYVEPAAYVLSENFTQFMLVVGFSSLVFWYFCRKTVWLLISMLTIGYAGLIRPTYQALAFAMGGSLFITPILFGAHSTLCKNVVKAGLIFICVSTMIPGCYALMNYYKFNYLGLSPLMPIHLSTRTARVLERLPDEYAKVREALIRARDADLVKRGGSHTGYGYMSNPGVLSDLADITGFQTAELAKFLTQINLLLIREAPLEYLYDIVRAFSSYWFPSSSTLANMHSRYIQFLWSIIHFCLITIFYLTFLVLFGMMVFVMICRKSEEQRDTEMIDEISRIKKQSFVYMLAASIVIYSALISSMFETGDPRYRVPTDGLIILMSFLGIYLLQRIASHTKVVFGHPT